MKDFLLAFHIRLRLTLAILTLRKPNWYHVIAISLVPDSATAQKSTLDTCGWSSFESLKLTRRLEPPTEAEVLV